MFNGSITNVPHVPRGRAFRDARALIQNPVHVFERYRKELGPTFTFHFGGAVPAVVSTDPAFIEQILRFMGHHGLLPPSLAHDDLP